MKYDKNRGSRKVIESITAIVLLYLISLIIFQGCNKNEEPVIYMITPISNVAAYVGDSLYILADAYDPDGSISKVEFMMNDQIIHTDNSAPYEFQMDGMKEGNYRFYITATDNDNEQSAIVSINVNVIPNDEFIVLMSIDPTNDIATGQDINIEVTAQSPYAEIDEVSLFINDQLFETIANSPYNFIWTSVPEGSHSLYAEAIDKKEVSGQSKTSQLIIGYNKPPDVEVDFHNVIADSIARNPGTIIRFDAEAEDDDGYIKRIEIFLDNQMMSSIEGSDYLSYEWLAERGTYEMYAIAYDNHESKTFSSSKIVHVRNGIVFEGNISDMTYSDVPEINFAIDEVYRRLIYIDPIEQVISKEFILPDFQPVDFDYSIQDKKLYIVSYYSGNLTIWDKNTETYQQTEFSESHDGREVKVDDQNRRIYVLADQGFYILNMDNLSVIYANNDFDANAFVIDNVHRNAYFRVDSFYTSLSKFSVEDDELNWLISGVELNNGNQILSLCPNNQILALPDYEFINFIDVNDINSIDQTVDLGYWNMCINFNKTGTRMYSANEITNGDPQIFILDVEDFSILQQLYLPYADDYVKLSANIDETAITAFTVDGPYTHDHPTIYFYTIDFSK